jgi:hypothetical protein
LKVESENFYLCETDLYMGDMVIQFPNPDHKDEKRAKETISCLKGLFEFQNGIGMRYNVTL